MECEHEEVIAFPEVKLTVVVGLARDGEPIVSELWENIADPDTPASMFTKLGIIGMLQQSAMHSTLEATGGDDGGMD